MKKNTNIFCCLLTCITLFKSNAMHTHMVEPLSTPKELFLPKMQNSLISEKASKHFYANSKNAFYNTNTSLSSNPSKLRLFSSIGMLHDVSDAEIEELSFCDIIDIKGKMQEKDLEKSLNIHSNFKILRAPLLPKTDIKLAYDFYNTCLEINGSSNFDQTIKHSIIKLTKSEIFTEFLKAFINIYNSNKITNKITLCSSKLQNKLTPIFFKTNKQTSISARKLDSIQPQYEDRLFNTSTLKNITFYNDLSINSSLFVIKIADPSQYDQVVAKTHNGKIQYSLEPANMDTILIRALVYAYNILPMYQDFFIPMFSQSQFVDKIFKEQQYLSKVYTSDANMMIIFGLHYRTKDINELLYKKYNSSAINASMTNSVVVDFINQNMPAQNLSDIYHPINKLCSYFL